MTDILRGIRRNRLSGSGFLQGGVFTVALWPRWRATQLSSPAASPHNAAMTFGFSSASHSGQWIIFASQ